jgi:hypothetical protein
MTPFEILIDDAFVNVTADDGLDPIDAKSVLSLLNNFEDKKWRFERFQTYVWDNIAETALSAHERNCLSGRRQAALVEAAKNLRLTDKDADDPTAGSELAEIILYGIMKDHYEALPVVPKIFYKQNRRDNAKGADSVHIVLEGENNFSLWLGESKFYNSIDDARLGPIIDSVEDMLSTDKLKKENAIITSVSDLSTLGLKGELVDDIRALLSGEKSIDDLKPKLHIPILLLHECEITAEATEASDEYRELVREYHRQRATSYFRRQIKNLKDTVAYYASIHFHVILFPVPVKKDIVERFLTFAKVLRNE